MSTQTDLLNNAAELIERDDLSHTTCCDPNRGLCGVDLTDAHDCPEDLSCGCQPCVVCEDLIEEPCRPGCDL